MKNLCEMNVLPADIKPAVLPIILLINIPLGYNLSAKLF